MPDLNVNELNGEVMAPVEINAEIVPGAIIQVEIASQGPQGPQGETGETGPAGADGADGFSPVVSVSSITGGHEVSITDAVQTQTFNVMDGQDGADGNDGADGVSPVISSESITGGHRLTIVDAGGTTTVDVMDGQDGQDGTNGTNGTDGQDGVSPEVSIASITGGHSVTITDADHPGGQTFNVMDGQAGSIDIFWCTYGTTTSAEIETALAANELPCVIRNDTVYIYGFKTSATKHYFSSTCLQSQQYLYVVEDNGSWAQNYINIRSIPSGGNAGQLLAKNSATDFDVHWVNKTQDYPSAYCTTAAGTAAKKASCSLWVDTANSYLHVLIGAANTNAGAITLNVNSTGAKPIYINGEASSATNYTLPAGSYIVFYDGTSFYFRTDGKLTADITGTAGNGVPSGGTQNQVLLKSSNANFDTSWGSMPYGSQIDVLSGTQDLNDYTAAGMYYFGTDTTLSNQPNGAVNGWLIVLVSGAYSAHIKQIWLRQGSNPETFKEIFERYISGTDYGSWSQIAPTTFSDVTISNVSTQNCSGTVVEMAIMKVSGDGKLLEITGRPYINNYSRSGSNPGIKFKTSLRPSSTVSHRVGIRGEGTDGMYPENVILSIYTDGSATLTTTESFTNANHSSRLIFMIPGTIIPI